MRYGTERGYSLTMRLLLVARATQDHGWTDGAWYRLEYVPDEYEILVA